MLMAMGLEVHRGIKLCLETVSACGDEKVIVEVIYVAM